jgi:hypothetical protein
MLSMKAGKGVADSAEDRTMDAADLAIEGAGVTLLAVLVGSVFALVANRRRIVIGACLGLGLAALALPFAAYLAARITNHHATDADLTPPAYIVVTALVCAGLALAGGLGGLIAEARHPSSANPPPDRLPGDDDYTDDPARWLPWRKADDEATS